MLSFWNERYAANEYAYGEAPNAFLKTQLAEFPFGNILFPAEGEGRNAVYAASLGWEVHAFDQSEAGQKKALQLAQKHGVEINYFVNTEADLPYKAHQFDAMALIYAHFPGPLKSAIHQKLTPLLKPGGIVIFEAFSKKNLEYVAKNPSVGGPRDFETLLSIEEIQADFADFEPLLLREEIVDLQEGLYHNGQGAVIRFVGRKR